MKPALRIGIVVAALCVVTMLVWQGITAHGAPDPTRPDTSPNRGIFWTLGSWSFARAWNVSWSWQRSLRA